MKYLLILLAFVSASAYGQSIGYWRYDTVVLQKVGGNSELKIMNATRALTGGVLTNMGNGRTAFVAPAYGTLQQVLTAGNIADTNINLTRIVNDASSIAIVPFSAVPAGFLGYTATGLDGSLNTVGYNISGYVGGEAMMHIAVGDNTWDPVMRWSAVGAETIGPLRVLNALYLQSTPTGLSTDSLLVKQSDNSVRVIAPSALVPTGTPQHVVFYAPTTGVLNGIDQFQFRAAQDPASNTLGMLRVGYNDSVVGGLGPEIALYTFSDDIGFVKNVHKNFYQGSSNGAAVGFVYEDAWGRAVQLYATSPFNAFGNSEATYRYTGKGQRYHVDTTGGFHSWGIGSFNTEATNRRMILRMNEFDVLVDSVRFTGAANVRPLADSAGFYTVVQNKVSGALARMYIGSIAGGGSGTVTSVDLAYGITGSSDPITTSGTVIADTSILVNKAGEQIIAGNKHFTGLTRFQSPNGSYNWNISVDNSGNLIMDANVDWIFRRGAANKMNLAASLLTLQSGVGLTVDGAVLYVDQANNRVGALGSSPTSTLYTAGSFGTLYAAKTTTYTITETDHTIEATSGTFTVTLPTAVGISGRQYTITNSGAGVVTLATTSSQTFANYTGTPTTLAINQFYSGTFVSNGANWLVVVSRGF